MSEVIEIPIDKIKVGEHEQRLEISNEELDDLANSIARIGLVCPCIVVVSGDEFILVAGHRRLAACKQLGRTTVKCLVEKYQKVNVAEITFAENFFRKDLSPVELAGAIKDVCDDGGMTLKAIAAGFHRSTNWVQSMVAVCDWPPDVLAVVHTKDLSLAAAHNLALVTDTTYREYLVRNAVEQGATARTTAAWLQAWRSMAPQEEAVAAEPVPGQPPAPPITPQAPCFFCSTVHAVNEMSHVPICVSCIQLVRQAGLPATQQS